MHLLRNSWRWYNGDHVRDRHGLECIIVYSCQVEVVTDFFSQNVVISRCNKCACVKANLRFLMRG